MRTMIGVGRSLICTRRIWGLGKVSQGSKELLLALKRLERRGDQSLIEIRRRWQ